MAASPNARVGLLAPAAQPPLRQQLQRRRAAFMNTDSLTARYFAAGFGRTTLGLGSFSCAAGFANRSRVI